MVSPISMSSAVFVPRALKFEIVPTALACLRKGTEVGELPRRLLIQKVELRFPN